MSSLDSWFEEPTSSPSKDETTSDLDLQPMDPDVFPIPSEELLTRRVHIIGMGSIGTLVAHSLRCLPNPPPVTILLNRREQFEQFKAEAREIRLVNTNTRSRIVDQQSGFDVDLLDNTSKSPRWEYSPQPVESPGTGPLNPLTEAEKMDSGETFIYTLIVAVKGPATEAALNSVKHRVDSRTTILFMQNGMGQIDVLNKQVFTNPRKRPTYMLGIISHGCHLQKPFAVRHAGFGSVALGIYRDVDKYPLPPKGSKTNTAALTEVERQAMFPTEKDLYSNLSTRYLLRTMTRSPVLACAAYPYLDLFQLQLEKLVANCLLNPLTAVLDVRNGLMLDNLPLRRIHRLLIAEISLVILGLPELDGLPNADLRFSTARLEKYFRGICKRTAENSSSMREDIRKVRGTEVQYLNGYIVRRGQEQGVQCVLNYMLMQLIMAKNRIDFLEKNLTKPYGTSELSATREGDSVVLEDVSGPAP